MSETERKKSTELYAKLIDEYSKEDKTPTLAVEARRQRQN